MICPACRKEIPENAAFCPKCGAQIAKAERPQENGGRIKLIGIGAGVIAIVACVLLLAFVVFPGKGGLISRGGSGNAASGSALDLHISQVDNSAFPIVTLYASIDKDGAQLANASPELFSLSEVGGDGAEYVATIDEIVPLAVGDAMNINLVLDQSGSMSGSKMSSAQSAANAFASEIVSTQGTVAEITGFNNYVYNVQPFTSDITLLKSAVYSLRPDGETALYDALYWALQRTNLKSGSRVVIAFTDGEENASYYGLADVVELSRLTGIPVYVIGVGDSINRASLQSLASQCNGTYFDAATSDLQNALQRIYGDIYSSQRQMYRVVYTSSYTGNESEYRTVRFSCSGKSGYSGDTETVYMPVDNVSSYETSIHAQDYVLPDSGTRYYSRAELEKLSLWELYLARNEIFARYGRGFKKQDLVDYFATKRWYHETATPEQFDARPSPLNDYEQKNTATMLAIEKERKSPYIKG